MNKVKVLFFAADPLSDQPDEPAPKLRLDREIREVRLKVQGAKYRDWLKFDTRWAVQTDDLLQGLLEGRPQVVHFSGHGSEQGLVLVGADGCQPHSVPPAALVELFRHFEDDIRLVVLNACFSLPQAKAIAQAVGCAIGTPSTISDTAAITFAGTFYRAIAFGSSVQAAYDQARIRLAMDDFGDEQCPRLEARHGVDPAKLFLITGPCPEPASFPEPDPDPPTPPARSKPRPASSPSVRGGLGRARMLLISLVMIGAALVGAAMIPGEGSGARERLQLSPDSSAQIQTAFAGLQPSVKRRAGGSLGSRSPLPSAGNSGNVESPPQPLSTAPDVLEPELASAVALSQRGIYAAAFPVFKRLAEAGEPEAMVYLALAYQHGQGTNRSDSAGAFWLRKSASNKRNAHAMNVLAAAYLEGVHLRRSLHWARYWYEAAVVEKHDVNAMYSLGTLNRSLQRFDSAFYWFDRAAHSGSLEAGVDLGEMFERGQGREPNLGEARKLYREAADRGSARAREALARLDHDRVSLRRSPAGLLRWILGKNGAVAMIAATGLAVSMAS